MADWSEPVPAGDGNISSHCFHDGRYVWAVAPTRDQLNRQIAAYEAMFEQELAKQTQPPPVPRPPRRRPPNVSSAASEASKPRAASAETKIVVERVTATSWAVWAALAAVALEPILWRFV